MQAGLPPLTAFSHVFNDLIVSMLSMDDLLALSDTCRYFREVVCQAKDWESLYEAEFADDWASSSENSFANYYWRSKATVYTWVPRGNTTPQKLVVPTKFPIREIAASRIAMIILDTFGDVYGTWLNDSKSTPKARRLDLLEPARFCKVWGGMGLVFALDTEGKIHRWQATGYHISPIPLDIPDLTKNLVLARSGEELQALLVRGLGIVWWIDSSLLANRQYHVIPGTDPDDPESPFKVVDMLVLRYGLVLLTRSDEPRIYWVPLVGVLNKLRLPQHQKPIRLRIFDSVTPKMGQFVTLYRYNYYMGSFIIATDQYELFKAQIGVEYDPKIEDVLLDASDLNLLVNSISPHPDECAVVNISSYYRQHLALTTAGQVVVWGTRGNSVPDKSVFGPIIPPKPSNKMIFSVIDFNEYLQYGITSAVPLPLNTSVRVINGTCVSAALVLGSNQVNE